MHYFTPFLLLLVTYNITRHGFGLFLAYMNQCFVKIYKCAQWTQFRTAIVRFERYYVLAYVLNVDECTQFKYSVRGFIFVYINLCWDTL